MPNSYTALYAHVIFSTKHREPTIDPIIRERLHEYMGGILREQRAKLLAAGGMPDHVHLLISLHASTSMSDALRLVKTNSSKWIHETHSHMRTFGWQDGYAAFSVSRSNLDGVRAYIARQEEHHRTRTFQDELIEFLERHDVAYDPRYLWD